MLRYLLEVIHVQAGTAFRGVPTVMDGLLKLLAAFWVCELPWITLYCCEASEWVLRLTRGVCSWDCMSSQEGGWDRISTGHVERIRKGKVWKCTEPSLLEIPVSQILYYGCENQVSWYSVFCSTLQVFVKCIAKLSHMPLEVFYMQNCNVLAY